MGLSSRAWKVLSSQLSKKVAPFGELAKTFELVEEWAAYGVSNFELNFECNSNFIPVVLKMQ